MCGVLRGVELASFLFISGFADIYLVVYFSIIYKGKKKKGRGKVLVDKRVFDGDGSIPETVSDMDRDPWRGVFVHCGLHCA